MDPDEERKRILALHERLGTSGIGQRLILAGSSGLSAASQTIPALTEDVDVFVDADWVADNEEKLLAEMEEVGLRHQPGTCTFLTADGQALDLVGFSCKDQVDRIGGSERVPVMVYADASRLMTDPRPVTRTPRGGPTLSPPGLAVIKLLTVRIEKGSKDKLQALLLIAENDRNADFLSDVRALLSRFGEDQLEDAVADAQVAVLALSGDETRADRQSRGYARMRQAAGRGLRVLTTLVNKDVAE